MSQGMNAERALREVRIPTAGRMLSGTLGQPRGASGVVLFAHGSGSGRFSPRNQFVAESLRRAGLATLLIDLLGEDEAEDRRKVFDIELLAWRLLAAALWLGHEPATRGLRMGYFGASTGAAAALVAAARRPELAGAVVSRGGRPDLARGDLPDVTAPTLLIVGGLDEDVLELNRQALALLRCPRELVVIPGATHLFPEPGTLEEVARLAEQWFLRHLGSASRTPRDLPDKTGERVPRSDLDDQC
jgi:putative phosphoribosyl transferase